MAQIQRTAVISHTQLHYRPSELIEAAVQSLVVQFLKETSTSSTDVKITIDVAKDLVALSTLVSVRATVSDEFKTMWELKNAR